MHDPWSGLGSQSPAMAAAGAIRRVGPFVFLVAVSASVAPDQMLRLRRLKTATATVNRATPMTASAAAPRAASPSPAARP